MSEKNLLNIDIKYLCTTESHFQYECNDSYEIVIIHNDPSTFTPTYFLHNL